MSAVWFEYGDNWLALQSYMKFRKGNEYNDNIRKTTRVCPVGIWLTRAKKIFV